MSWAVMLAVVLGLVAGAATVLLTVRRKSRSYARETQRSARLRAFLQGHGSARLPSYTPTSARDADEQLVVQYLRLVRETCAVQTATLWRVDPDGAPSRQASSGQQAVEIVPARLDALLRWAASEPGVAHFDGGTPTRFGAIAVSDARSDVAGNLVLAIQSEEGISGDRAVLRSLTARHAEHLSALHSLLETRHEVHRQHASASVLLRAAQEFQANRSLERLAAAICSAALDLSSAQRAALVRWRGAAHEGQVEGVSAGHWAATGLPVVDGSLVAQACTDAIPLLWRDARELSTDVTLFSSGEDRARTGTLAIVPLERELGVVGAIVLEGEEAGDVTPDDVRSLRLLAAIAAVSLEAQWEFDEVAARARTDELTGLPNRRFFDEQLARMLAEADRFEHSVSLVLLDIDHFKRVNDEYGHDTGDEVLRAVAAILREKVRGVDVCARFGGEELSVLLPNTGQDGAVELAERLRLALAAKAVRAGGREVRVTASFGIAAYPSPVTDAASLFAAADKALYAAKGAGRDCVRAAS